MHCSTVDDLLSSVAPRLIIKGGGGRRIFYEQQSVALEAVRGCAEGTHSSGCFGDEKHGSAEIDEEKRLKFFPLLLLGRHEVVVRSN